MENKENVIDSFKVNIEAVLDDKALNEIADKLCERIESNFRKAGAIK